MYLEYTFLVMRGQRLIVAHGIPAGPGFRQNTDGHCLPENRQSLLKNNSLLFMQKHETPVNSSQLVPHLRGKKQMLTHGINKVLAGKIH